MISPYTIYIKHDKPLIKIEEEYIPDHIYINKNMMYLGSRVHLIIESNKHKKRKTIHLESGYTFNIGISMNEDKIYVHLLKYIPFPNNKFDFEYVGEKKEEIKNFI